MPEEHPTKISEIFVNKVRLLLENDLISLFTKLAMKKLKKGGEKPRW